MPRIISTLVGALLLWPGVLRADAVDDYVSAQIVKRHIPGLSLGVVLDGKLVKARGFGLAKIELGAMIDACSKDPLRFAPGQKWEYSNTGYYLLGRIINNGKTYDYGFAFFVHNDKGHRWVSHDGRLGGFTGYYCRHPDEKISVIVLTNQSNAKP